MGNVIKTAAVLLSVCVGYCISAASAQSDIFLWPGVEMKTPSARYELPRSLLEISGLATASLTSVVAHNDEYGIVYEISLDDGRVVSAFALGDPTVEGDFEGIAVADDHVYLVTSKGLIYEAPLSEHGTRARYNVYDTGAWKYCEIEGLSKGPSDGDFLLLCKTVRGDKKSPILKIYRWNIADREVVSTPYLKQDLSDLITVEGKNTFRPSGIEWSERSGRATIISARSKHLLTLNEDGSVAGIVDLSGKLHRQAEGITIMPSGALVIADEGFKRRAGSVTVYAPMP